MSFMYWQSPFDAGTGACSGFERPRRSTARFGLPEAAGSDPNVRGDDVARRFGVGTTQPLDYEEWPDTVEPGEEFVYTIVVSNTGDANATVVVVTDELPEGVTLVSSDPPPPTCQVSTDASGQQTVTCTFATLPDGDSETIEFTVQAPTNDFGTITNQATVDSTETEEEDSNTVSTLVAPLPLRNRERRP